MPNPTPNRFYLILHLLQLLFIVTNTPLNFCVFLQSNYTYLLISLILIFKYPIYVIVITYLLLKHLVNCIPTITQNRIYISLFMLQLLLLCGDIHPNPGPNTDSTHNYLQFCHINARSLTAPDRLSDITDFTTVLHSFDIIAISETHLGPTIPDTRVHIDNYCLYRRDRDRRGGGVCLYISDTLQSKRRTDLETDIEIIWVEVTFREHKILISSTYRPPGRSAITIHSFMTSFQETIDLATNDNAHSMTILGDFNDRCTNWHTDHHDSDLKNKLHDLIQDNNLHQLISDPTRQNNILDLIITDSPNYFLDSGVIPHISDLDHEIIFGKFNYSHPKQKNYKRHIWLYDRGNYIRLNNILDQSPWHEITDDSIDNIAINITNTIHTACNTCIPNKTITVRPRDKPWMTSDIRKLLRDTHRLHKKHQRTKNPTHKEHFLDKRRETNLAIKTAKKSYYKDISSKLNNKNTTTKTYWKLVKQVYGNKQSSSISTLLENNITITDDTHKANILNEYFSAQTKPPDTNIPLPAFEYLTDARLSSINITPTIVKNVIINLNTTKAMGQDQISNKVLKECAQSLCFPLSTLFNKSISQGIFPNSWKEALVTAIFKKSNRQLKSNYRPISLLSCISKIFERIIHDQLYSYCTANNLLTECNSGFKNFDSAINRLISITNDIHKGLDKQKEIILIFLDISKAFN
jgi:hypothetical protein